MTSGIIVKLATRPLHTCSAFLVPKSLSAFRLVIDLWPINAAFPSCKVHYESLAWLHHAPRDTQASRSLDLQDGYHHFRLHPTIQKYYNFEINGY